MDRGEGLTNRKELPNLLFRDAFIVKHPLSLSEEEETEGLFEEGNEDEPSKLEVVMIGKECKLVKIGDDVIIGPNEYLRPRTAFRIDDDAYMVYHERDIIGIW